MSCKSECSLYPTRAFSAGRGRLVDLCAAPCVSVSSCLRVGPVPRLRPPKLNLERPRRPSASASTCMNAITFVMCWSSGTPNSSAPRAGRRG